MGAMSRRKGKLTPGDVANVRALVAAGARQRDVAAAFGIHQATVSEIVTGKIHRYRPSEEERFLDHVSPEPTSGCWLWTGSTMSVGYGRWGRSKEGAHRVAWRLWRSDPGDLFVCHRCDNRACVNPDHLFLGSLQDNHADMVSKRRHTLHERHPQARITKLDATEARRLLACGKSQREVAVMFGLTPSAIGRIWRGETWG